jgi:ABC-2 type transport system permease protein
MKEFLRERAVLFWTVAWPIIWVIISSIAFTGEVPEVAVPYARGSITISMTVFALMMAGMTNLPSSITGDRQNGMLTKLMSMPISPRSDFMGRILALGIFSALAGGLVIAVGAAIGGRYDAGSAGDIAIAVAFFVLIVTASAGVGLLLATFVHRQEGAIMSGVGISVISAAISGMFAPYDILPAGLQAFSRFYPISAASNVIRYYLLGPEMTGYNPVSGGRLALTIALCIFLLVLGSVLYSKRAWQE